MKKEERGGGQCFGLKSQNNRFHFFDHYEWFKPRNNTISKRNVILIRASVVLKRTDSASELTYYLCIFHR